MSEAPMSAMGEIKKTTSKVTTRLAEFRPEARQLTTELFRLDLTGEAARSDLFLVKDGNLRLRDPGRALVGESLARALKKAYLSPEIIDEAIFQLRADLINERMAILQDKQKLRQDARARFVGHTRLYKVKVDVDYNAALSSSDIPAREALLKRKQLLLKSYRAKIQAERTKPQRELLIEEYKKQYGKKPSAIELTKYKLEKAKAKAAGEEGKRQAAAAKAAYEARVRRDQQERIAEIHRKIAERKARVTRQLEFKLRGWGYELGRVLQAMRKNALQTVITGAVLFALGWGVGRLITSPPALYGETPIAKITQLIGKHKGRYSPGSPPRIETPEPGLAWEIVSPTATKPPEPTATKPPEPTVTKVPTKQPTSTAVPTREPSPTATRPPAMATREPQPTAVPTKTETTGVALAEADKKTREAVMAATEAHPWGERIRKLIVKPVSQWTKEDIENTLFGSDHAVNIIEFRFNWKNATRTPEELQKDYEAYATGVIEGLKKSYDINRHLTVLLEPGHQSNPTGIDSGSVFTLANGKVAVEKKYNLETAKVIAKRIAAERPNWDVVVTVDDGGFQVESLASLPDKKGPIDNVDWGVVLRAAERKIPGKVIRLSLHYNGGDDQDEVLKRDWGSVIPPRYGTFRDESIKTGNNIAEALQVAVKKLDPNYRALLEDIDANDPERDPYVITESRDDDPNTIRAILRGEKPYTAASNKFNRRLLLARTQSDSPVYKVLKSGQLAKK